MPKYDNSFEQNNRFIQGQMVDLLPKPYISNFMEN
jgi:hypothetical protein